MNIKLKSVIIFETAAIMILLAALIYSYSSNLKMEKQFSTNKLLSPNIYAGIIEPKSLLIVNFKPLKQKLQTYIKETNANVSVYVENLRNGAFMGIDEKAEFYPASLNKLPVAILIMKSIENGELTFYTKLQIKDSDRTNISGKLFKTKEKELPLRTLLEKMLTDSDNTAARVLFRNIDTEDFKLILDYYGIDLGVKKEGNQVTVEDLMSPKSISNLFSSLYFLQYLSRKIQSTCYL